MSTRQKLRLWIELAIATGLMVLGSLFVRYAHGETNQPAPEIRVSRDQQ